MIELIKVNNLFTRLIKEISITKYGSDKELVPTFFPYEVYQYSDSIMKHLPKDSLKTLEKTILYSNMSVYLYKTSIDSKVHNGSGSTTNSYKTNDAKDLNIDDEIDTFQDQLKDEYVYKIPLRYFTDFGKINLKRKGCLNQERFSPHQLQFLLLT